MKSFALIGALTVAAVSVSAEPLQGHGAMRRHHSRAATQALEKRAYNGHATYYNTETGNAGSCGDMLSNNDFTVAVTGTMMNSGLCGKTVTISANGKTTQARIVDTCPPGGGNCGGPDLDLSPALFKFFNPLGVGKFAINWSIGGQSGGGNSGGGGNNQPKQDNGPSEAEKQAAAEAARKKAAAEKAQAAQDKKDAAAASASSVSAAARASSVSVVSASRASVASVSRASVASEKSASRASASAEAKASAKAVAEAKEEERTRPKNIENFGDILHGMTDMVNKAKDA